MDVVCKEIQEPKEVIQDEAGVEAAAPGDLEEDHWTRSSARHPPENCRACWPPRCKIYLPSGVPARIKHKGRDAMNVLIPAVQGALYVIQVPKSSYSCTGDLGVW